NFQIASGSAYNNRWNAQFTRLNTASGNGITDVFGLQGIDTDPLGNTYVMKNNIDATGTSGWNSGVGFKPIGNQTIKFSGSFNGNGYVINGLYINSNADRVGLFGDVSGTISNLGMTNL